MKWKVVYNVYKTEFLKDLKWNQDSVIGNDKRGHCRKSERNLVS